MFAAGSYRVRVTDSLCSRELLEVLGGLRVRWKELFSSVRCCTAVQSQACCSASQNTKCRQLLLTQVIPGCDKLVQLP